MHAPADDRSSPQTLALDPASPSVECPPAAPARSAEAFNLGILALHQVVWRIGWTFKNESIILPAFLDRISGAGWIRGCLPLLRNLGQSVPPLFSAELVRHVGRKKWILAASAVAAGVPYLAMAGIWLGQGAESTAGMAAAFLSLYFLFFVFYGIYQVSSATVQGKLVRPTRRGRLLWGATLLGLLPTVLLCTWLMPGWLASPELGYACLFACVGALLMAAGLLTCLLVESSDRVEGEAAPSHLNLRETLRPLRHDSNLRRLIAVILLLCVGVVTIPHYQTYARQELGLGARSLVLFVVTQTTAVTVYSMLVGPLADRWGYRLTLRVVILGAAVAPGYALLMPVLARGLEPRLFWLVFIPLGLAPLIPTILINYALELSPSCEHPRYVSIVNLAMMPPHFLSPLVGHMVDRLGFALVSLGTFALMLLCGILTFWLAEPRHVAGQGDHGPRTPSFQPPTPRTTGR